METPEWDLFKRLEELEPEIEKLKPEVDTATKVSVASFLVLFMYMAIQRPDNVRGLKDLMVGVLKDTHLRRDDVEVFERLLLKVCDVIEERR